MIKQEKTLKKNPQALVQIVPIHARVGKWLSTVPYVIIVL